jgi:hypothetical protein
LASSRSRAAFHSPCETTGGVFIWHPPLRRTYALNPDAANPRAMHIDDTAEAITAVSRAD